MTPVEDDEELDDRTVQEYLEDEVYPLIDFEETRYPVIVAVTEYKVAWVEGDSPANALKRIQDDGEWYERLSKNDPPIGFDASFDLPDPYQWSDPYFGNGIYIDEQGPIWRCPHCGHHGFRPRNVLHTPECPDRRER